MTSPLLLAPNVSRIRVANRLWVNKAPNPANTGSSTSISALSLPMTMAAFTTAENLNPITKQHLKKHKAYRIPRRPKHGK